MVQFFHRYIPSLRPSLPMANWKSTYWPSVIAAGSAQLQEERAQAEARFRHTADQLHDLKEKVAPYKPLVYSKSDALKDLVAKAFTEVLGLSVTDMDGRVPSGNPKVFDLLLSGNGVRFAVEVRGKERRGLSDDDIDQVLTNIEKSGLNQSFHPMLVLNAAFEFPVGHNNRRLDSFQVAKAANKGVTILPTWVLLDAMAGVMAGKLNAKAFVELLSQPGECTLQGLTPSENQ